MLPVRSPANIVPSGANASPQVIPRSLDTTVTDPSRSILTTVPSYRLVACRNPSGAKASDVALVMPVAKISRTPPGVMR